MNGSGSEGPVAVVTGGSRGMGREISRDLACRGFRVVVASQKGGACAELARELRQRCAVDAVGLSCRVGHRAECDSLVERTPAAFGRVDVLVNNAGMSPVYPSLAEVSEELFDEVIGVNLKGPPAVGAGGPGHALSPSGSLMPSARPCASTASCPACSAPIISRAWTPGITANSETAPLGRIAQPDEIVGAVRYLTSADSSYTTGAIVKVGGGLTWASG